MDKDLYNKIKHAKQHRDKLELKQFIVEEHLKEHPTDYRSVISNEKLKNEIYRVNYKLKELYIRAEL